MVVAELMSDRGGTFTFSGIIIFLADSHIAFLSLAGQIFFFFLITALL